MKPNVILLSYCLTNEQLDWQQWILQAKSDLSESGIIAVVDFHTSRFGWFKNGKNSMDGQWLPFLKDHFQTVKYEIRRAYFGLWHYTLYIGQKNV